MVALEIEPTLSVKRISPVPALEPVFPVTSSDTAAVWQLSANEVFSFSAADPFNGIICNNNPVNMRDPFGLVDSPGSDAFGGSIRADDPTFLNQEAQRIVAADAQARNRPFEVGADIIGTGVALGVSTVVAIGDLGIEGVAFLAAMILDGSQDAYNDSGCGGDSGSGTVLLGAIGEVPEGFRKTNYRSHGQPVYTNGKMFITPDVDSHIGGAWKGANTIKALGSSATRMGTYDILMRRIGK